jgi:hypothetical protein
MSVWDNRSISKEDENDTVVYKSDKLLFRWGPSGPDCLGENVVDERKCVFVTREIGPSGTKYKMTK